MYEATKELIQQQMAEGVFPGASFAFLDDHQVEQYVWGLAATVPEQEILKEDMLYDMASLTKIMCTSLLVLKLWEDGEIDIDSPFNTYYPSFEDSKVTIRHLLTHTSAINPWIENRDNLSAEELKEAFNFLKSTEEIGRVVKYTDTGTVLLGFMLEEIYGKPAQTIFQERVLDVLGMRTSAFQPISPKSKAVPTEVTQNRGVIRGETHDPKAFILGEHAGSAGLFSTLKDTIQFTQKVFFDQTFLKPETIFALLKDGTPTGTGHRSLAWDLKDKPDGGLALFHSGFTGTFITVEPVEKKAFVFLSNRVHPENHRAAYIIDRDKLVKCYLRETKI